MLMMAAALRHRIAPHVRSPLLHPDMMSGSSAKKIRLRTLDLLSCATGKLGDILAEALRRKLQCFDGCQVGKDCLAKGLCRHSVLERQHQSLDAVRTFGRKDLSAEQQPGIRSEEHTSELQSLMRISYAVFCLKKKHHTNTQ